MLAVLSITFPIFATIGIGYLFFSSRLLSRKDLHVLASLTLNLALPALLFNAVASKSAALDPNYLGAYAIGTLATLIVAYRWFLLSKLRLTQAGVAALGSCMPNSGFVGYPILLLAMPEVAKQALAMNVLIENLLILPLCLVLMSLDDSSGGGIGSTVLRSIATTLRRPLMLAILLGAVVSLTGHPVPIAIIRLAELIGQGAAPLALLYIGGSLSGLAFSGNWSIATQIAAMKLVLHPVIIAGVLALAIFAGVAPSEKLAQALVLTAAVPMISSYAIFASEKGQEGIASIAMLVSTICSFLSLSALLALFN
jgi:malonate transporter